jgi:hypothetical protein
MVRMKVVKIGRHKISVKGTEYVYYELRVPEAFAEEVGLKEGSAVMVVNGDVIEIMSPEVWEKRRAIYV